MSTTAKRKFVYQPHDEAVIKRAKEAEYLDRWRIQKGMDDPKLDRDGDTNRHAAAGVRRVERKFMGQ